jgi:Predicted metal-binding protein
MKDILKVVMDAAGVHEYGIVETAQIEFSHEVRKMCEANTCRQYGKTWACPPAVGTVEVCRDKCLQYEKAIVFTGKFQLEDSFDIDGMELAMKDFKKIVAAVGAGVKPHLNNFLLLGNEGCGACEVCAYPGNPCRFPEKAHGSIEGYGIWVNKVAEAAGVRYINGVNTVTFFGALLY